MNYQGELDAALKVKGGPRRAAGTPRGLGACPDQPSPFQCNAQCTRTPDEDRVNDVSASIEPRVHYSLAPVASARRSGTWRKQFSLPTPSPMLPFIE
jgi:hypothetical protein